jgi:hypothetical protein
VDQKLTGIKAASQANGGGGSLRTLEAVHFGHMDVDVTIDDPGAYTKPFSFRYSQTLTPDTDLLETICAENEKDRTPKVAN